MVQISRVFGDTHDVDVIGRLIVQQSLYGHEGPKPCYRRLGKKDLMGGGVFDGSQQTRGQANLEALHHTGEQLPNPIC